MPLTDLRGALASAVAADHSVSRLNSDWLQLVAVLATIAREATAGRVTVVKTRPGLDVPGVAYADLQRALIAMSGRLWSAAPDQPAATQPPLLELKNPDEQRRALAAYGVLAHELGHVLCTLLPVAMALREEGFNEEYAILEEPRMEASMGRRNPWYRGCYGYAFTEFRLRTLADAVAAADPGALVDCAVRALGADHGALLHRTVAGRCRGVLADALRPALFEALDDLCRDLVRVQDDDVDAMRGCCKRLRRLLEEEGIASKSSENSSGSRGSAGAHRGDGRPSAPGGHAGQGGEARGAEPAKETGTTGSLSAADIQAIHDAQQQIQPDAWPPARTALTKHREAKVAAAGRLSARAADRAAARKQTEVGTAAGIAGSPFDPVEAWRVPTRDEEEIANDLARRLSLVPVANDRRMLRRYPPGSIDTVQMMHREAQLARGLSPSAEPFARMERSIDRLRDPRIVVLLDTSSSMKGWIERATGIGWAVARAAVLLRGRVAMVGFGNQVTPILDPAAPSTLVPIIRSDGGTMFVRQAWERATDRLNMRDPNAPRLLVVVSDGDWQYPRADRELLEPYLRGGVAALTVTVRRAPKRHVGVPVAIEHPRQLGRVVADVFRELVLAHRTGRPPRVRRAATRAV
jgi:VWA domain-containing protein